MRKWGVLLLLVSLAPISSCKLTTSSDGLTTTTFASSLPTTATTTGAPTTLAVLPTLATTTEVPTTTIPATSSSVYASFSDVVATEESGVVRIQTRTCDNADDGSGSGFFVRPGLIVTAAHVVNGDGYILVDRVDDRSERPAKLVGINVAEDVALLRTTAVEAFQFSFEDVLPAPGADIGLIGYSGGRLIARPVRGTVTNSSIVNVVYGPNDEYRPGHVVEHDLQTNPGDSGAPLLDPQTGRVFAIDVASDRGMEGVKWGIYAQSAEALIAKSSSAEPIDQCVKGTPLSTPTTAPAGTAASSVPPETAVATTAVAAGNLRYRVLLGDTLLGIARAFNITVAAIQAVNDPSAIAVIHERDIIVLPVGARPLTPSDVATVKYTVQPGDTIIGIAKAMKTTPAELLALNMKLGTPDSLSVGQVLLIPRVA